MASEFRYRSRVITSAQVEFIRRLIARHPGATRRRLSLLLCEAWEWKQANGAPRDMVCRGLLLGLHRAGHIELPPARLRGFNPAARYGTERWKADAVELDTTPLAVPLSALRPLEFRPVRRTPEERLFNSLLEQYHPLHCIQPVGEHLKYTVYALGRPIACLAWSSAPRHLGARDRFIGWSVEARRHNLLSGLQSSFPHSALGASPPFGVAHPGADGAPDRGRLGADVWASGLLPGDLRRS